MKLASFLFIFIQIWLIIAVLNLDLDNKPLSFTLPYLLSLVIYFSYLFLLFKDKKLLEKEI